MFFSLQVEQLGKGEAGIVQQCEDAKLRMVSEKKITEKADTFRELVYGNDKLRALYFGFFEHLYKSRLKELMGKLPRYGLGASMYLSLPFGAGFEDTQKAEPGRVSFYFFSRGVPDKDFGKLCGMLQSLKGERLGLDVKNQDLKGKLDVQVLDADYEDLTYVYRALVHNFSFSSVVRQQGMCTLQFFENAGSYFKRHYILGAEEKPLSLVESMDGDDLK